MKNVTLSGGMPKRNGFARFVEVNRSKIVEVIAALFILLFLYTAINKLQDIDRFIFVLNESPLINNYSNIIAWGLPILELITAILLFIPRTKLSGLKVSFVLMIIFTLYLGYMLAFTPKLPCSCGGVISKMSWKQHLLFNSSLTLLALWAILLSRKQNVNMEDPKTHQVVFT